ncbi:hypothetical protein IAE51_10375 [Lactococcus sp. S64]|uniref:SemiSWEET family transporter n=1 Tax=Lactococcus sp. S64 TaxID=2767459 RepID=UPI001905F33A|nr:SemiSWEET family transporter [Lactococcus sp. S64]MBK0084301.1 hypothetical protein [Lactococcus sp. S64]
MDKKNIDKIGRIASIMSVCMYVSYVPQIMSNLNGQQGNPIQPFVAMVNCIVWTLYASLKKEKDIAIIVANVPGIFLGLVTFVTSI